MSKPNWPENKLLVIGYILTTICFTFLYFSSIIKVESNDSNILFFFVGFILNLAYLVLASIKKQENLSYLKEGKALTTIILSNFLLLCFVLNNSIEVFGQFPSWVFVYLFLTVISILMLGQIEKFPKLITNLVYFLCGISSIFVLYFAIHLSPIYLVGLFGLIFFGITFSLFVPLLILILSSIIIANLKRTKQNILFFVIGMTIPLIGISLYLSKWDSIQSKIHKANSSIVLRPDNKLPIWLLLSQDIGTDSFTSDIIKGKHVFDSFGFEGNLFRGNRNFDQRRAHDPLVNIGLTVLGDLNLDVETRVKLLKSNFNARHHSHRRLWSSEDLITTDILNNIKIYPDFRFAYSEKIITIKNTSSWKNDQQEAIYTFHLPDGSVATSLSLWIEGKEEKSRLTTKSKADSAYVSIVGVERRDPALMHWQEGNRLTVTVFPCTPSENRIFKIGVTSPLEKEGTVLTFNNIYIEGPYFENASETTVVQIESENDTGALNLPSGFTKDMDEKYIYSGNYRNDWKLSFNSTTLSKSNFNYGNYSYHVKDKEMNWSSTKIKNVYIDLNNSWDEEEFNSVINEAKDKKIYVYNDKIYEVNKANKADLFTKLNNKNFSLFPFHLIDNNANSLVVTKSGELSPNLSDIEETKFYKNLTNSIGKQSNKLKVFQLGKTTTPYLKTLKEYQVFNFYAGSFNEYKKIIGESKFPAEQSDTNRIDIDVADMSIVRDSILNQSNAPDHLLRLFAYSNLMRKYGNKYFEKKDKEVKELVEIANEAYIVSPISSLIVLETLKDYERFEIDENKNSLKNASMKSSGAVPEPHEWVLISLFCLIVLIIYKKRVKA